MLDAAPSDGVDASEPRTEQFVFEAAGDVLSAATVRVTRTDGAPEELETDAAGRLTVEGVVGPLTLVLDVPAWYQEAPVTYAFVDMQHEDWSAFREPDGSIRVRTTPPEIPSESRVVAASHLAPTALGLHVGSNTYGQPLAVSSQTSIQVPLPTQGPVHVVGWQTDEAGDATAENVLGFAYASASSLSELGSQELALDFEPAATELSAETNVRMPSSGLIGPGVVMTVRAEWDGPIQVGLGSVSAVSGTDVAVSSRWVEPDGASAVHTELFASGADRRFVGAVVAASPAALPEIELLEPMTVEGTPTWATLASGSLVVRKPLSGMQAGLTLAEEGRLLAFVTYGANVSTLTLPLRPGSVAISPTGTGAVDADLRLATDEAKDGISFSRMAYMSLRLLQ